MTKASPKQAEIIGAKLYTQTKNKKHCEKWVLENLTSAQASPIVGRVMKLTKNFSESNPGAWSEIRVWGRQQIKELGYKEEEQPKSL